MWPMIEQGSQQIEASEKRRAGAARARQVTAVQLFGTCEPAGGVGCVGIGGLWVTGWVTGDLAHQRTCVVWYVAL